MKRRLSVIALFLAVMMLILCLAACGNDEKAQDPVTSSMTETEETAVDETEPEEENYDGDYKITAILKDGEDFPDGIGRLAEINGDHLSVKGNRLTWMGNGYTIDGHMMRDVSGNETEIEFYNGHRIEIIHDEMVYMSAKE